jgi:methylase of polypeptide subunit release factors
VGWNPDEQRSFFDSADSVITVDFYEAMHSLSTPTGEALGTEVDFSARTSVLDLGGGSAAVDIALCQANPHLRATVLDLPSVVDFAAAKIRSAQLSDRIDTVTGDLFGPDAYPGGHDIAILSLIMHSFTKAQDRHILDKTYACPAAVP